jgi:hypothetical protein
VLILGFYITATQANARHQDLSDSYRKVHTILEAVDGLLSRAWLHNITTADTQRVTVLFSRPATDQPITVYGNRVYLPPEIMTLQSTVNATDTPLTSRAMSCNGQPLATMAGQPEPIPYLFSTLRFPLNAALNLTSVVPEVVVANGTVSNINRDIKAVTRTLFQLDPGWQIEFRVKPKFDPAPPPGMPYAVLLDIFIPERTANPIKTVDDLRQTGYLVFERYIQLENCDTGGLVTPPLYVP